MVKGQRHQNRLPTLEDKSCCVVVLQGHVSGLKAGLLDVLVCGGRNDFMMFQLLGSLPFSPPKLGDYPKGSH